MYAVVARIVAWVGSWFAAGLADKAITWIALKVFLTALFMVALPYVLNSVIYSFMEFSMGMITDRLADESFDTALQFTGIAAWLLECFKVPECIAVLVSALQLRLVLKMIPMSPIK